MKETDKEVLPMAENNELVLNRYENLLEQKRKEMDLLQAYGNPKAFETAEKEYYKLQDPFERYSLLNRTPLEHPKAEEFYKDAESNLPIMEKYYNIENEKGFTSTPVLPDKVIRSLENNIGMITNQHELSDKHYLATALNKKGTYDSIEVTKDNGGWKLQIKSGFPEREQAIQHNMKLQNQIAKDFDYKPSLER